MMKMAKSDSDEKHIWSSLTSSKPGMSAPPSPTPILRILRTCFASELPLGLLGVAMELWLLVLLLLFEAVSASVSC